MVTATDADDAGVDYRARVFALAADFGGASGLRRRGGERDHGGRRREAGECDAQRKLRRPHGDALHYAAAAGRRPATDRDAGELYDMGADVVRRRPQQLEPAR